MLARVKREAWRQGSSTGIGVDNGDGRDFEHAGLGPTAVGSRAPAEKTDGASWVGGTVGSQSSRCDVCDWHAQLDESNVVGHGCRVEQRVDDNVAGCLGLKCVVGHACSNADIRSLKAIDTFCKGDNSVFCNEDTAADESAEVAFTKARLIDGHTEFVRVATDWCATEDGGNRTENGGEYGCDGE